MGRGCSGLGLPPGNFRTFWAGESQPGMCQWHLLAPIRWGWDTGGVPSVLGVLPLVMLLQEVGRHVELYWG